MCFFYDLGCSGQRLAAVVVAEMKWVDKSPSCKPDLLLPKKVDK
jgi:hypothetical protein